MLFEFKLKIWVVSGSKITVTKQNVTVVVTVIVVVKDHVIWTRQDKKRNLY